MEETNTGAEASAKMPQFLKVLCILSFIGTGLSLVMGVVNYFSLSAMAAMGNPLGALGGTAGGQMGDAMNSMANAFGLDYGKMATSALIVALVNIPILLGVIMMWKRKKTGYFVYAAFELIQAIVPIVVIGGLAGGVSAVFYIIVAIAFIIMYGVNLKHMS